MSKKFFWCLTFVWAGLIFWNSVNAEVPGSDLGISYWGYFLHFVVYALLSFLIFVSLKYAVRTNQASYFAAITAFLYGLLLEMLQHFIPYRNASVIDASLNGLGALAVQLPIFLKRKA